MKTPFILLALFALLDSGVAEKPCKPVARAMDKQICAHEVGSHPRALLDSMWVRLFEDYAKRKQLQPTEDEIRRLSALFDQMRQPGMEPHAVEANFIRSLILNWKVGRDLHRQHGGRVMLSSFGFHMPIEALQVFLREEEKRGSFEIHDDGLRKTFWQEITTGMQGDGVVEGEEAKRIYETPPWEQKVP